MKRADLSFIKKRKRLFYISIVTVPIIQFIVFYVIVNANTLILALQKYEYAENGTLISKFVGIDNILQVFKDFVTLSVFKSSIKNSLAAYAVGLIVITSLSLLFSYYIFKKYAFGKTFKILLYLPNIVSVMVLSIMYKFLLDNGVPIFFAKINPELSVEGLLSNPNTSFTAVMVFSVLVGFGSNVLIYTGTMSGISQSMLEAAEVDGANDFQEFLRIVMPQVYPTLVTFLVAQVAMIFTNQINLFNFYGLNADPDLNTFGYYIYKEITINNNDLTQYPYLAAVGFALTCVALPVTLGIRQLLNAIGPSED